ncbi:YgaP family membrane protein [Shimia ponticola]|uniref:YgaP family membrane protein n=1 Tax=Shimia ponticola TaxID=2582893 RepID=UPI0011BF5984|nr:DUF2892 domain-containing protein [Shimia ponticola]
MMTNMGTIDRGGRLVIAAVLAFLALGTGALSGVLFWIALVVAAVFTLTALVGNCPLYRIVGLKTCKDC